MVDKKVFAGNEKRRKRMAERRSRLGHIHSAYSGVDTNKRRWLGMLKTWTWPRWDQTGRSSLEAILRTPRLFAAARSGLLPHIVLVGEEDSLVTTALTDGLDGSGLLLLTGASRTVALTASGPTALQVDDIVTTADIGEEVELASDELTSGRGLDLGVEVGVDVGTGNVDNGADGGSDLGLLPDVEGLGNGVGAGVAGALGLDNLDEVTELTGGTEVVHDGLVTDDEEFDEIPLGPLGNGINLLLDVGSIVRATGGLDKDTNHHVHVVLATSTTNRLEGVAVGGVRTDNLEASILEVLDIGVNLARILAVTVGRFVRGVGDTVVVVAATEVTGVGGLLLGLGRGLGGLLGNLGLGSHDLLGRLGGLRGLLGNLVLGGHDLSLLLLGSFVLGGHDLGLLLLGSLVLGLLGGLGNLGRSGDTLLSVRADVDVVRLGDGHDLLRGSVGTRDIAGGDGVDDDGLLVARLGDRTDGVGTGSRADEDGGLNDAGDGTIVLGLLGNGAGDGGLLVDNGGDTAQGVSSGGNLGGLSRTDGGGLGDGDGGGREGVGTGSRTVVRLGSREGHDGDNLGRGGRLGFGLFRRGLGLRLGLGLGLRSLGRLVDNSGGGLDNLGRLGSGRSGRRRVGDN